MVKTVTRILFNKATCSNLELGFLYENSIFSFMAALIKQLLWNSADFIAQNPLICNQETLHSKLICPWITYTNK